MAGYSYGIPDGTYVGKPTTASCYEKDGRLILDIRFAVKDPQSGTWYKKENGYDWEVLKRFWLTSADGAFNEATIKGLKEWAKGWEPRSFDDFYWFQNADANGTPFGNLVAIGEVELNFQTKDGSQSVWVHDPNRPKGAGRTGYVPEGANTDRATLMAKWGSRAKALFASAPKKVATTTAQTTRQTAQVASAPSAGVVASPSAPARPAAAPARPAAKAAEPSLWASYPQEANGAFAFFCAKLKERGETYQSAKHDGKWFEIYDKAAEGKDPDLLEQEEVQKLFACVAEAFVG